MGFLKVTTIAALLFHATLIFASDEKDSLERIKNNLQKLSVTELARPTKATFNTLLDGLIKKPISKQPTLHQIFALYISLIDSWKAPNLRGKYKSAAGKVSTALMRIVCAQDGWELSSDGAGQDNDLIALTMRAAYYAGMIGDDGILASLISQKQDVHREKQKRYAAMLYMLGKFGIGSWQNIEDYGQREPGLFDENADQEGNVSYREVYQFALKHLELNAWLFIKPVEDVESVISHRFNNKIIAELAQQDPDSSPVSFWKRELGHHYIQKTVDDAKYAESIETADNYQKTLSGKGSSFATLESTIRTWQNAIEVVFSANSFKAEDQRDRLQDLAYEILYLIETKKLNAGAIKNSREGFTHFLSHFIKRKDQTISFDLTEKAMRKQISELKRQLNLRAKSQPHLPSYLKDRSASLSLAEDLKLGQIKFISTADKLTYLSDIPTGQTGFIYVPSQSQSNPDGQLFFKAYQFQSHEIDGKRYIFRVLVNIEGLIKKYRFEEIRNVIENKNLVFWYDGPTRTLLAIDKTAPTKYYKIMSDYQKLNEGDLERIAKIANAENLLPLDPAQQKEIEVLKLKAAQKAKDKATHTEALKEATQKRKLQRKVASLSGF